MPNSVGPGEFAWEAVRGMDHFANLTKPTPLAILGALAAAAGHPCDLARDGAPPDGPVVEPRGLMRNRYVALKERNGNCKTRAVAAVLFQLMKSGEDFEYERYYRNRRRRDAA